MRLCVLRGLCSRYVLLVSGLGIGSSWSDQLSIEMLVDYITGQLGGASVSRCNVSHARSAKKNKFKVFSD